MSQGDNKIDSGFRVIGHNTVDGALHMWFFDTQEAAHHFAKILCAESGSDATVTKFIGRWRRSPPPVEFIPDQGEHELNGG